MTTASKPKAFSRPSFKLTRLRIIAIVLLVLGAFIFLQAGGINGDLVTTLTFEPTSAGETPSVGNIDVPTSSYLRLIGLLFFITGILNLAELRALRWRRASLGLMILCGILFIPTVIIAAAAGNETNMTTIVAESLRLATPLAIGAMAGIWCERAGVVNIAIEGMMLFAACFGFTTLFFLRNTGLPLETAQLLAVIIALLSGGLIALLHGWLSITFRTDQIVSGTVINILAVGVTSFVRREYLLSTEAGAAKLGNISIPILSDLPVIGDAIFHQSADLLHDVCRSGVHAYCDVLHALGLADARRGRTPSCGGYAGHQRQSHSLDQCLDQRHGRWFGGGLVLAGGDRQLQRWHDPRRRLHRAGGDDLRQMDADRGFRRSLALRLFRFAGHPLADGWRWLPGAVPADGALRRDADRAGWFHWTRLPAEGGWSALCEGMIYADYASADTSEWWRDPAA